MSALGEACGIDPRRRHLWMQVHTSESRHILQELENYQRREKGFVLWWVEAGLCQYFQGCPSVGSANWEPSKALSGCILQSFWCLWKVENHYQSDATRTHPNVLFYLPSFWPSDSCPSNLIILSPTFHFYPSSHQGISLVLYSWKASKDSRHFPGSRGEESLSEAHQVSARDWSSLMHGLITRNAVTRPTWGAEILSKDAKDSLAFLVCMGQLAKGVALLAISLLETLLLKQVLCAPIGLPRHEAGTENWSLDF